MLIASLFLIAKNNNKKKKNTPDVHQPDINYGIVI